MDSTAQLRAAAIPLAGADPALPEDDLAPLLERLVGARLIGLGEATHGDHESFAFKCRLIQALVRRHACDAVIFERGVAEMDAYDRYVAGQTPSLNLGQDMYPWRVEEVRDLFAWLREWNDRGGAVRLAGMDMFTPAGLPLALSLLADAGMPAPSVWQDLAAEANTRRNTSTFSDPWYATALARWQAVAPPQTDLASPRGRWIVLLTATFRQWLEYAVLASDPDGKPWELRDRFMAENALAQLERFGPATKAVIWAHNSHVYHEPPVAGSYLRANLGAAYRSVCCVFGRGSFNAGSGTVNPETKRPEGSVDWTLCPHAADPPPDGSLEHVLDQLDLPCYAVEPAMVETLRSKLPVRNVGIPIFAGLGQFSHACVPADVFDLLVYFQEVQPSRLLGAAVQRRETEGQVEPGTA